MFCPITFLLSSLLILPTGSPLFSSFECFAAGNLGQRRAEIGAGSLYSTNMERSLDTHGMLLEFPERNCFDSGHHEHISTSRNHFFEGIHCWQE